MSKWKAYNYHLLTYIEANNTKNAKYVIQPFRSPVDYDAKVRSFILHTYLYQIMIYAFKCLLLKILALRHKMDNLWIKNI